MCSCRSNHCCYSLEGSIYPCYVTGYACFVVTPIIMLQVTPILRDSRRRYWEDSRRPGHCSASWELSPTPRSASVWDWRGLACSAWGPRFCVSLCASFLSGLPEVPLIFWALTRSPPQKCQIPGV